MSDVSVKFVEKIKTNILCSVHFSRKSYSFYEEMWENMVEPDRPLMTT